MLDEKSTITRIWKRGSMPKHSPVPCCRSAFNSNGVPLFPAASSPFMIMLLNCQLSKEPTFAMQVSVYVSVRVCTRRRLTCSRSTLNPRPGGNLSLLYGSSSCFHPGPCQSLHRQGHHTQAAVTA